MNEWIGVFASKVWILYQDDEFLHYTVYDKPMEITRKSTTKSTKMPSRDKTKNTRSTVSHMAADCSDNHLKLKSYDDLLTDYFQLHVSLCDLYEQWAEVDSNFKNIASVFPGIRQLRQDPVENLFSFICSSNNNIARISKMVESLCREYGDELAVVDGITYHDFPPLDRLAGEGVEQRLRELGFGYRAKYLSTTARLLQEKGGRQWLSGLRSQPYDAARQHLLTLSGVGPKVADCVCLMSLDKTEAIPIDTHVIQVAKRDYGFKHEAKTVTDKAYQQLGAKLRSLWGEYAGWAQSVLFSADLKMHQAKLAGIPSAKQAKKRKEKKALAEEISPKKVKLKR